jgi:hypothetical protein
MHAHIETSSPTPSGQHRGILAQARRNLVVFRRLSERIGNTSPSTTRILQSLMADEHLHIAHLQRFACPMDSQRADPADATGPVPPGGWPISNIKACFQEENNDGASGRSFAALSHPRPTKRPVTEGDSSDGPSTHGKPSRSS